MYRVLIRLANAVQIERVRLFCHFVASMISGLVTTIASMPVDIAKTRLQSMKYIDGK